ncbi:hypothetical protein BX666DRAFT_2027949 [Dichotomocladium elegans]|nr:hypothetical protein BX666DRAFT_2027949 [Dichotomocladium elegans]
MASQSCPFVQPFPSTPGSFIYYYYYYNYNYYCYYCYLPNIMVAFRSIKFWQRRNVAPTPSEKQEKAKPSRKQQPVTYQWPVTQKFLNDPMRNTSRPDVVGYYYDPMSVTRNGRIVTMNYDITNTGA